ncbi:SalK OS=Tsukamurella paurometabola (strain ATCC 8368 / DSM / CCUG 35730 / CIP 100753 / JCM 10117/ KCTC 9821 / NBRC 16120 / NCIMB 702349 / NCTC 13040) OX=521096 GN=Tpau_3300 PE=4 SV=1 [Tsukamurella paurometabola]|uniref:SalK n=1 Tax=Tsukamurella paurometabola (strain ATCC 8368 / DSM 20162 / CCUG 35730 / CIP 100753 / JCM 10117 / KCTC 9821 / NBRC 16120 / NCIMB 702349 / NCTC 13040) TaxID=521096 RepID=D5UW86_TSUPD|nr:hypothetical protein [Tsukamurella paurometabola]ADG79885.1 conserved hypothetical protein [Tsukamurella paurometabola DSM 20162]SUP37527.1 Uncharacterised protein [Tsukamurella paurometabola]
MSDTAIALARRAYETVEPFHVVAYFNPGIRDAQRDLGLDGHAFYVGARAAPIGESRPAVVTAAFYNFAPALIDDAWPQAIDAGLAEIDERRYVMLAEQYREILAGIDAGELAALAAGFGDLVRELPIAGRTLAAAWASSEIPDDPALALWRHITVLREWRGDNHLAELVRHGLTGLEAGVLHEADLPDPTVRRRVMGRRFFRITRGWSEDQWNGAVARLTERGLVEGEPEEHRLTADGMATYLDIEAGTDAISAAAFADGSADLIERVRPVTKAVLDAGIIPGTKKS